MELLIIIVVGVAGIALVAFLLKGLVWWWFGIDEHMKKLDRIIQLLENNHATPPTEQPQPAPKRPNPYDLTP